MNPYDWQTNAPGIEFLRPEVDEIVPQLRRGGSVVTLGGRGMGKSVFLRQLRAELERDSESRVLLIPEPPPNLTVDDCLEQLAEALGVTVAGPLRSRKLFDAYFTRDDVPERLVLLFDEFDRYAEGGFPASPGSPAPGRAFFNDLESARRSFRRLGVLAAGSIGIYVFRDVLGSGFLSRAARGSLGPFDRQTAVELARPFAGRGQPLSDDVLDALLLASGGIPALLIFGLEQLWDLEEAPTESHVTGAFIRFQESHSGYLDDVRQAFSDPRLSQAPQRVLELIRRSPGPLYREQLAAACEVPGDALSLGVSDVLELLRATGLVHVEGSVFRDNPVEVRPIPSLLNLPTAAPLTERFRDDFLRDLTTLLETAVIPGPSPWK